MEQQKRNFTQQTKQQSQQQLVLFKFKRPYHQQIFDQLKIKTKKIKANPEDLQKASNLHQINHVIDHEMMITNLLSKLQLTSKQNSQKNLSKKENEKKICFHQQSNYFLKRVVIDNEFLEKQAKNEQIQKDQRVKSKVQQILKIKRKQEHKGRFERIRNLDQKREINKRIKYKIIDIKQESFVELNGQKIEYQDLSKEYSGQQKQRMNIYDYYVLTKGKLSKQNQYAQIVLPQEAEYLIEQQHGNGQGQKQQQMDSQSDSNREDRSDYDYPQEDYNENESDKSQDIISGNEEDNHRSDADSDMKNSDGQQDEEEYYRKYLRRCEKREQGGDDQFQHIYNMKMVRYDQDASEDDSI